MRVRTEEKRQSIVRVSAELFDELGYERTSMSTISQRVGGSKATLYGYFRSKEELLLAVLEADLQEIGDEVLNGPPADVEEWLRTVGLRLLKARTMGRSPTLLRIMSSLPDNSTVGRTFYDAGMVPAYRRLCSVFERLIAEGVLRPADPWTMAMHFKGLLDRDYLEQAVLAPRIGIADEEVEQAVAEAADVFLRAYKAEPRWGHAGATPPGPIASRTVTHQRVAVSVQGTGVPSNGL